MNNQQLRQIYDGFTVKDMSFSDFAKEMRDLSDPIKIREDLANIELLKARARTNKIRIDRAMEKKNNA